MNGDAERSEHGARWNVGGVERSRAARHPYAHAPRPALDDQGVAIKPDAIGNSRQQWIDGRKDTSAGHVGADICCERTSVDDDGDRSSGWE
jgi:hypothetical protein